MWKHFFFQILVWLWNLWSHAFINQFMIHFGKCLNYIWKFFSLWRWELMCFICISSHRLCSSLFFTLFSEIYIYLVDAYQLLIEVSFKLPNRDFPGDPVAKTLLPLQGAQAPSLLWEIRFRVLHICTAWPNQLNKQKQQKTSKYDSEFI